MTTNQTPKTKGKAMTKMERMAWKGLLGEQQRIEQAWADFQRDANEARREIEERLGLTEGALGGMTSPPTHDVDTNSWNIVEVPALPGEEAEHSTNGATPKIKTHAQADQVAVELGLAFDAGTKLADKVAAIDAKRSEAPA